MKLPQGDAMFATGGPSPRSARALGAVLLAALLVGAPAALAADPVAVQGVSVGTSDDVTVVRVGLDVAGGTPTVSPFRQTDPERLVVDISGAKLAEGASVQAGGLVQKGELSTFNDGSDNVRLTLWLTGTATWDVSTEGGAVLLTLRPGASADPLADALGGGARGTGPETPSGPQADIPGAALTSLDFQQKDKVSRVVLGLQQTEPAVSQPERNLIAVDLPGAQLPDSLQRELNTKFFYSAVESVRAVSTRAGTRVLIRLREGAEYTVSRDGDRFTLDIQVPADILARRDADLQRAATAAPATPETNGTAPTANAKGQTETLITSSGRAVDPNAVFAGNGSGQPGGFTFASDMTGATVGKSTARRISIDLQEADIHTVFRFIADFAEMNIITSDDVKGKVTVRLKDVPWDEALGAILQAKGLGAQRFGNIVRVAPIETIKAEQQAALETKRATEDLAEQTVYIAPLNYAQASEVQGQVQSLLSARGSIQVDANGNQLIIRDSEDRIAQVRELIKTLDKPNRQVNIEARFVEATATFTRNLGIQWGGQLDASAATGYPLGAFFPNSVRASGGTNATSGRDVYTYDVSSDSLLVDMGVAGATSSMAVALGSLSGLIDLNARLSALENEGWGKVISNPRITALDNEEARVSQGARIPYVSQTGLGAANVQFVQANLELTVTPHITAEGTVFLDINITNDRPDFGQVVGSNPTILTKEIETRVLVPDGDTAVLGGVYATTDAWSQDRVPGLGSIPILGALFRATSKSHTQQEMLVFITPRIVPLERVDRGS